MNRYRYHISFAFSYIPILLSQPFHEFDSLIKTHFVADVTSKSDVEHLHFSMFRALTVESSSFNYDINGNEDLADLKFFSAERMNIADNVGIVLTSGAWKDFNGTEKIKMHEFSNYGEDPRIVSVGSDVILSFTMISKTIVIWLFLFLIPSKQSCYRCPDKIPWRKTGPLFQRIRN